MFQWRRSLDGFPAAGLTTQKTCYADRTTRSHYTLQVDLRSIKCLFVMIVEFDDW